MTTPALAAIPVRSDAELTERWAELLAGPSSQQRVLWLAWFRRDGTMLPVLTPVEGFPERPDRQTLSGLGNLHESVMAVHLRVEPLPEDDDDVPPDGTGVHLALALARPGTVEPTEDDDECAQELAEFFSDRADGGVSVQLVGDDAVMPLARRGWWPR